MSTWHESTRDMIALSDYVVVRREDIAVVDRRFEEVQAGAWDSYCRLRDISVTMRNGQVRVVPAEELRPGIVDLFWGTE